MRETATSARRTWRYREQPLSNAVNVQVGPHEAWNKKKKLPEAINVRDVKTTTLALLRHADAD